MSYMGVSKGTTYSDYCTGADARHLVMKHTKTRKFFWLWKFLLPVIKLHNYTVRLIHKSFLRMSEWFIEQNLCQREGSSNRRYHSIAVRLLNKITSLLHAHWLSSKPMTTSHSFSSSSSCSGKTFQQIDQFVFPIPGRNPQNNLYNCFAEFTSNGCMTWGTTKPGVKLDPPLLMLRLLQRIHSPTMILVP